MVIDFAVGDGKAVEFLGRLAVVALAPPIPKAAGQQLARFLRVALLDQDDTKAVEYGNLLRPLSADSLRRTL